MALPIQATVMGTFLDGNGDSCEGFVEFSNGLHLNYLGGQWEHM